MVTERRPAEHQLQDLHLKLKPKNRRGITKKDPIGKPHQISITEGWVRKVQFGGNLLLPRYNSKRGSKKATLCLA